MENELQEEPKQHKRFYKHPRLFIGLGILAVVLVLAVIGLREPLHNTFIAIQNAIRRSDYSKLVTSIKNYIKELETSPDLPDVTIDEAVQQMTGKINDPAGNKYIIRSEVCGSGFVACPGMPNPTIGEVFVIRSARCEENFVSKSENDSDFVVLGYQENAGPACVGSN